MGADLQQLENIVKSKGGNVSLVGKDKVLYIVVKKGKWNIQDLDNAAQDLIKNPKSDYYGKISDIVIEEF